ncbi:helix-turn-helix domain-containing protein [Megasphaera elsdenii]|uniref:helix-turn-helix domain-containing protein n=1 Tax=Megasphaera elsdenii TaxID=907 RepID=UPI00339B92DF
MARRKKNTPLNDWERGYVTARDEHFTRIGDSLLNNEVVHQLRYSTFYVLVQMEKASAGRREFDFKRSYYEKHCGLSPNTVIRAVKELEQKGFIRVTHETYSSRPNRYVWINDWKKMK